ncbi:Imm42 family immunity protein [Herbaspirillum rubrisubalbicans]|uniref:Imm42 family immunity protein n=1 Tax=Herbaspirillum rubrisubalbicans TaxID=80842 RepID=UPI0015C52F3D|nr:Imm42 family immunity protein [Herbaspirillum rubrisubalbicans]
MLAGNSTNFAFWYDVVEGNESFCFGPFNIFVNAKLLLSNSEDNFTLNIIASDLRRSFDSLDRPDELSPGFDTYEIFEKAMHTHGYQTISDPVFPSSWWAHSDDKISTLLDLFIDIQAERRTDPPFGVELSMYTEISDKGWRFFLFKCGSNEVLLCSNDWGKTVLCYELPPGEVRCAVEKFLVVENLSNI